MGAESLSPKRLEILSFISRHLSEKGYPPSVREIGEAVSLASSSTVHAHLSVLEREGYILRDPTKPRALEVRFDPVSRSSIKPSPVSNVPLLGEVAAGTGVIAQENVSDVFPLPKELTGEGELFMVQVRGESMIEAGIFDGDYVVVRSQPTAVNGEIVVAGFGEEEGTVKTFRRKDSKVILEPSNSAMEPMIFDPSEVVVYGKVVTVIRRV